MYFRTFFPNIYPSSSEDKLIGSFAVGVTTTEETEGGGFL